MTSMVNGTATGTLARPLQPTTLYLLGVTPMGGGRFFSSITFTTGAS